MVTAAAIIMISVFSGFILSPESIVKSIGFALGVAVLFDPLIVRMTIVPAVMTLLGKAAWWLPRWLDKTTAQCGRRGREAPPPAGRGARTGRARAGDDSSLIDIDQFPCHAGRMRTRVVALALTTLLAAGAVLTAPTAAQAAVGCGITYEKQWDNGTTFGVSIMIDNTGDAIDGWTLAFTFPGNQRITTSWPVTWSQAAGSPQVTATSNAPWNARLAPGRRIAIGFNGTYTGANTMPTAFTLNGTPCRPVGPPNTQVPTVALTSPVPNQVYRSTDPIQLDATASDDHGVARVDFHLDGRLVASDTTAPYTTTLTGVPAGQHTAQATAYDDGTPQRAAATQVRFWVDGTQPPAANPYVGARVYVNPEWSARALAEPGGERVADQPTAVWLDTIADIEGGAGAMGLAAHLDEAVAQSGGQPMVVQLVLYDLPGRNCGRMASEGELGPDDLPRYKAEFVDPIAEILGRPAYANLRVVTVVEPDSLPNLVISTGTRPFATLLCNAMAANRGYVDGIGYALAKLGAVPNVYNYLDLSHHGMIGWEDNLRPTIDLMALAARASGSTTANVRGFVTNTANYSALREPFIPMVPPYTYTKWVDWNQFNDELTFAQAVRVPLVQAGFPAGIGLLIDTSRNGWGGPTRPTGPSTSTDANWFVDESRIDRRISKGNYCNQTGAGLGERPTAAPVDGIQAYVWIKPPGESDGASIPIPGAAFDRMCDPTYDGPPRGSSTPSGALPGAPPFGAWFPAQFRQLMQNAYPPL
ncbi:glycoside hydrolase family 6 protein [Phytohabitans sp. LJ34]|uniref:glycoside hydrolase family 6 protein n=1 Tax=Phytohabitans sp. LJ34 TaxID=3452217 RepID=UPI003F8CC23C